MRVTITYRLKRAEETMIDKATIRLEEGEGVRAIEKQLIAICRERGDLLLGFGIGQMAYE